MLSLRVSLLEKICIMLRVVRTQLECCCCPVGDVLGILGSTPDLKELMFIPECIKLCDSEPFPQAWSDSLSSRKNTVGLTLSDISRLVSFGRSLGTTALEGQIANCDMFCADFEIIGGAGEEKEICKSSAASRRARGRSHCDSGCLINSGKERRLPCIVYGSGNSYKNSNGRHNRGGAQSGVVKSGA